MVHLILLSGGSGTRLWPLSNDARSKQFLKVLRDEGGKHVSMVQRVFSQIKRVSAKIDITIATCAGQQASIDAQLKGGYALVLEPERRDTAPAIMLACAHLFSEQGAARDDTVIVMPIDTFAEQDYFDRMAALDAAVRADAAELVLLGVKPAYPSAKYGYIVPARKRGCAWPVERFKEKPSEQEAELLMQKGALWNCGVFSFKLDWILQLLSGRFGIACYRDALEGYSTLPKNSFDYEVVEKAQSIAVVPYVGAWKDLGTWNTLSEEMAEECAGRVVAERGSCRNTHVVNETGLPLVVAGIEDAVVVATPDGVLVSSKERSAYLKPLVASASESRPMYERRKWGEYRVLDSSVYPDQTKSLVKELVIESGEQLSYQRHRRRSEIWTVVSGTGEIVLDGKVSRVGAGSVIEVAAGCLHAARSFEEMHVVEVQLGETLIEEDIERFGTFWNAPNQEKKD